MLFIGRTCDGISQQPSFGMSIKPFDLPKEPPAASHPSLHLHAHVRFPQLALQALHRDVAVEVAPRLEALRKEPKAQADHRSLELAHPLGSPSRRPSCTVSH